MSLRLGWWVYSLILMVERALYWRLSRLQGQTHKRVTYERKPSFTDTVSYHYYYSQLMHNRDWETLVDDAYKNGKLDVLYKALDDIDEWGK